ncbi:hypothetical protein BDZ89DRAFT_1117271 [Hymenopellis radicata]|nr:hypothetical protein BDZ89DRAFT_1117271 [Hymenopellis radicata]
MDQPAIPLGKLAVPMLLGHFMNVGLFGVLCVQVFLYFQAFSKDHLWVKCFVAWITFIEIVQTVLVMIDGVRVFGTGWGNLDELGAVGMMWFSVPILTSILSLFAQLFFTWRILILSKAIWMPTVVLLVSIVQCVGGIWTGAKAHQLNDYMNSQQQLFAAVSVWLGGAATADLIIAGSLLFYLHQSQTDDLASASPMYVKVLRLIIETGLLCAVIAVLDLILFLVFRRYNYHFALSTALCKLYSNSLLVVLNSRAFVRRGLSTNDINTFSLLDTPSMDVRLRNMAIDEPRKSIHDLRSRFGS